MRREEPCCTSNLKSRALGVHGVFRNLHFGEQERMFRNKAIG